MSRYPSILFVCTGNICRSPTAEAVLRHRIPQIVTDSAGIMGYHIGDPPDSRTIATAAARGVDMSTLRARKVLSTDFERFDIILAMDRGHLKALNDLRPSQFKGVLRLFLDHHPSHYGGDVPDPYYGSQRDFEAVYNLIDDGVSALINGFKLNT